MKINNECDQKGPSDESLIEGYAASSPIASYLLSGRDLLKACWRRIRFLFPFFPALLRGVGDYGGLCNWMAANHKTFAADDSLLQQGCRAVVEHTVGSLVFSRTDYAAYGVWCVHCPYRCCDGGESG